MPVEIKNGKGEVLLVVPADSLVNAKLRGAKLPGANLRGLELRGCDLTGADLRGADLRGCNLTQAFLRGVDLRNAKCRDANFKFASLANAKIQGADLTYAKLDSANLERAKLNNSRLLCADFQNARMVGADLTDAITFRAKFDGARFVEDPCGCDDGMFFIDDDDEFSGFHIDFCGNCGKYECSAEAQLALADKIRELSLKLMEMAMDAIDHDGNGNHGPGRKGEKIVHSIYEQLQTSIAELQKTVVEV